MVHVYRIEYLRYSSVTVRQPGGGVWSVGVLEGQVFAMREVYQSYRDRACVCVVALRSISRIMPCVSGCHRVPGILDNLARTFCRIIQSPWAVVSC